MPVYKHKIDPVRVTGIANAVLKTVCNNQRVDIEIALLAAYCAVAAGVEQYPVATRSARVDLVVVRGSQALAELVEHVGRMSDAEILLSAPAVTM